MEGTAGILRGIGGFRGQSLGFGAARLGLVSQCWPPGGLVAKKKKSAGTQPHPAAVFIISGIVRGCVGRSCTYSRPRKNQSR